VKVRNQNSDPVARGGRSLRVLILISSALTAVGGVLIWTTIGIGPGLSVLITSAVLLASGLLVAHKLD
jgi:hypothetical protein